MDKFQTYVADVAAIRAAGVRVWEHTHTTATPVPSTKGQKARYGLRVPVGESGVEWVLSISPVGSKFFAFKSSKFHGGRDVGSYLDKIGVPYRPTRMRF